MSDPNDKAFADLAHWQLAAIPNNDSGAQEIGRRAVEAAFAVLAEAYGEMGLASRLEMLDLSLRDYYDRESIPHPRPED